jgi:hypothetical protein
MDRYLRARAGSNGVTVLDGDREVGTYSADTKFGFDGTTLVALDSRLNVHFVDIVTGRVRALEDEEEERIALAIWRESPLTTS